MPEPDVAAEVRRLIAAEATALPALVAARSAERAADAYFLHGVGSDAAPPAKDAPETGIVISQDGDKWLVWDADYARGLWTRDTHEIAGLVDRLLDAEPNDEA